MYFLWDYSLSGNGQKYSLHSVIKFRFKVKKKQKKNQLGMKTSIVGNFSSRMNGKRYALLLKRYCFLRKKNTEEKHKIIITFCIHCTSYFPKKAYQLKWWILTFTDSSRECSIYILQTLCYLFTILMQNYCFCNIYKDLVTCFQWHISLF